MIRHISPRDLRTDPPPNLTNQQETDTMHTTEITDCDERGSHSLMVTFATPMDRAKFLRAIRYDENHDGAPKVSTVTVLH